MDNFSEARLGEINPILAARIRKLAWMLEQEGIEIHVTQGLRSWNEQQSLWQQGRDAQGNVNDKSKVVTNAKAGSSWHNFGLACDVAPFDGSIPDWNNSHPCWARIVAVGESLGLVAGARFRTFPDWPHLQLTGRFPISPDSEVIQIFKDAGMEALWTEAQIGVLPFKA